MVLEEHICAFGQKSFLEQSEREKLGFLEEKRDCCVNLPFVQDLARRKKEKG